MSHIWLEQKEVKPLFAFCGFVIPLAKHPFVSRSSESSLSILPLVESRQSLTLASADTHKELLKQS